MTLLKPQRAAKKQNSSSSSYLQKGLITTFIFGLLSGTALATPEEDRLANIEDAIENIEERIGSRAVVQGFDAIELTMGGFLHSTFTSVSSDDGSSSSFNRQIFELLVRAQLDEDWSAFIAQAFIRESDINYSGPNARTDPAFSTQLKTPTVIAWADYAYSNSLNIQFGRFTTPHGIINIEHFPATLLDSEQPQFLRPFSGQTIFPNFVTGIQAHGRTFLGANDDNILQYNLYGASYAGTDEEIIVGARASLALGQTGLTIGLNASSGARTEDESIVLGVHTPNPASDYSMTGIDVLFDNGTLLWKNEYYKTDEELGGDREAYYFQPAYRISPMWTVFYRYDFLDDGSTDGDIIENVLGVNYTPKPNIRLRTTLTDKAFEAGVATAEADATIVQISATLSF